MFVDKIQTAIDESTLSCNGVRVGYDNLVQNVPFIRNLKASNLEFLDKISLEPERIHKRAESTRQSNGQKGKPIDLTFLMNSITNEVAKKGGIAETATVSSVDDMYNLIVDELISGRWNGQKK